MIVVMIKVYKNKQAQEDQPVEWVNLREMWLKIGYKIPYNRWVKYMVKNQSYQPRTRLVKTGGAGRPSIHYYVPLESAEKIAKLIQARRDVEIRFIRDVDSSA